MTDLLLACKQNRTLREAECQCLCSEHLLLQLHWLLGTSKPWALIMTIDVWIEFVEGALVAHSVNKMLLQLRMSVVPQVWLWTGYKFIIFIIALLLSSKCLLASAGTVFLTQDLISSCVKSIIVLGRSLFLEQKTRLLRNMCSFQGNVRYLHASESK